MSVDIVGAIDAAGVLAGTLLEQANTLNGVANAAFGDVVYPFYDGYAGGSLNFVGPTAFFVAEPIAGFVKPGAPAITEPGAIAYTPPADLADFTAVPEAFNPISVPSTLTAAPPGAAPEFVAPDNPGTIDIVAPSEPTLAPINISEAPSVNLTPYSFNFTPESISEPTAVFSYAEQAYNSALLSGLKTKLMADLTNGGYGIEVQDEASLWQRARDREARNSEAALQDVARQVAARNFPVPPGVLNALQIAAAQEGVEKNSTLSRDIMIKRGDLFVENRKFTITEVRETEQMLITYFGYAQERMLNASKAVVEMGLRVYEAKMTRLNYYLSVARAEAEQWEIKAKADWKQLEVWKADLEGKRVVSQINQQQIEIFRAKWEGERTKVDAHRAKVEIARVLGEFQMLKLQAFKLQVDIYSEEVRAKSAEFGMYEASVRGEVAKVEIFRAKVQAYQAQAEAKKLGFEAKRLDLESQIAAVKAIIEKNRGNIDIYLAEVKAEEARIGADAQVQTAVVRLADSANNATAANAQATIAANRAAAEIALQNARIGADVAIARSSQTQSVATALASTNSTLGAVYAQSAAAAFAAATSIAAQIETQ